MHQVPSVDTSAPLPRDHAGGGGVPARVACAAAALGTLPVFAIMELPDRSGAAIASGVAAQVGTLTSGTYLALLVAAGLFLSAARLGGAVPGQAGTVVRVAGAAVALMYAAYHSVFGAAAIVADRMLDAPGPGLGEAAVLLLNAAELTRYAPGLVLVLAVVAARRSLPSWVAVTAAVLAVAALVPMTSWVAALLVPLWLGMSAAVTSPRSRVHP